MANIEYCTMAMKLKDKIGGVCILKEGKWHSFQSIRLKKENYEENSRLSTMIDLDPSSGHPPCRASVIFPVSDLSDAITI